METAVKQPGAIATLGATKADLRALTSKAAETTIVSCTTIEDLASRAADARVVVAYGVTDSRLRKQLSTFDPKPVLIVVAPGASDHERELAHRLVCAELSANDARQLADEFASLVVHEIRGYLSTISLARDVLSIKLEGTDPMRHVDAIGRAVANADRVLDRLREMVAIQRSGLSLQRAALDARTVVESAVKGCALEAQRRRTELRVCVPHSPVELSADNDKLTQAFSDLLAIAVGRAHDAEIIVELLTRGPDVVFSIRGDFLDVGEALFARATNASRGLASMHLAANLARAIAREHGGWARAGDSGTSLELGIPVR